MHKPRPAVIKAVIPAAGLGSRFLPMTKAIPKEMLPLVDKPVLQYIVEEAVAADLTDVLLITGRNKSALENHFDRHLELEVALQSKGSDSLLASVHEASALADIHYVRQGEALGLGHAISRAHAHVGNEPFAVLLGDDVIGEGDTLLKQMLSARDKFGGSILALMEVPSSEIHKYGCAAIEPTEDSDVVKVTKLVEKPSAETAPSKYAVIGRYILDPAVFAVLDHVEPGRGGEIQLTDALAQLADMSPANGGGVHAVIFKGRRYDTGDKLSYLQAVVEIAAARDDLGAEFSAWLDDFVNKNK